jgi:hypothetical protein
MKEGLRDVESISTCFSSSSVLDCLLTSVTTLLYFCYFCCFRTLDASIPWTFATFQVSYLQVDEVTQNALLAALGSEWILAMDILQRYEGQKSVVSYNSVATACGQAMQWLEAVALLSLSSQALQELDCYSYTAIISASETLAWRQAWYFFSLQDDMPTATVEASNSALSCAKWQAALEVLGGIKGRCLVPTLVSFNATSSACARAVAWAHAVGLLSAMITLRLDATVPSCAAAATSCIRSQNFLPALQFLARISWLALKRCLVSDVSG